MDMEKMKGALKPAPGTDDRHDDQPPQAKRPSQLPTVMKCRDAELRVDLEALRDPSTMTLSSPPPVNRSVPWWTVLAPLDHLMPLPHVNQHVSFSLPGAFCAGRPTPVLLDNTVIQTEEDEVILGATLVEEEEDDGINNMPANCTRSPEELIEGKILPDKKVNNVEETLVAQRRYCWFFMAFLIVSTVIVGAALLGLYSRRGNDDKVSHSISVTSTSPGPLVPTTQNTPIIYPPFQESLTLATIKDIEDPSSPLYLANLWMLKDPRLETYSPHQQRQRFYLAMLYYATNGDHWLNNDGWMSYDNVSECEWYSHSSLPVDSKYHVSSVCDDNGAIISLSLASNNLTGTLPVFPTAFLTMLQVFDMDGNQVSGNPPPLVANPHLGVIIISNNHLTGHNTGEFGFPSLRYLDTHGNEITSGQPNLDGMFMQALQHSAEVIDTNNNLFAGKVATELGLCTNLVYFSRGNLMTGTIPSEIGLMAKLQHLDFSNNIGLTGMLPTQLGALTALTDFNIANTSLTGSIPDGLCVLAEDGFLNISANCSLVECCS